MVVIAINHQQKKIFNKLFFFCFNKLYVNQHLKKPIYVLRISAVSKTQSNCPNMSHLYMLLQKHVVLF